MGTDPRILLLVEGVPSASGVDLEKNWRMKEKVVYQQEFHLCLKWNDQD
jgi:hypothetical protein